LLQAWLDSGVRLIQLRAKHLPLGPLLDLAEAAQARCAPAGAMLIINDRVDVVLLAGAAGVHVGQDDLPVADVRRAAPDCVIGLSTHTAAQLSHSLSEPIDYVAIGPVFETTSKQGPPDASVGPAGVREAADVLEPSGRPLVAIGGITLSTAPSLIAAGASSVAVISDLVTPDWRGRARDYLRVLDRVGEPV
jgi:thiamine-phosphate pyrophosphorylase